MKNYLNRHDPYEIQVQRYLIEAGDVVAKNIQDLSVTSLAYGRSIQP